MYIENGFYWWHGVVENRIDDSKQGRVQVRIFGLHSDNIDAPDDSFGDGIKVEDLPWAHVMMPIDSASNIGIGKSPLGIVEGTWVVGFSRDGRASQDLVVVGSLPTMPKSAHNQRDGFGDHENTQPLGNRPKRASDASEHYPKADYLGEPDVNRLARNENIEKTIVKTKKDAVEKSVTTAFAKNNWDEPQTPYNAEYPYNHVTETESGHIIERDDTIGAERTHDYHRSGTFEEVHPDGTKVTKIVGDDFEISLKDKNLFVKGNINISVVGDCNIYSGGDIDVETKGNATINVDKNLVANIKGTANVNVDGTTTVKTPKVIADSPHIELGAGATEKLVLGDTFKAFLNDFIDKYNKNDHMFLGNLGIPLAKALAPAKKMSDSELSANNSFTK